MRYFLTENDLIVEHSTRLRSDLPVYIISAKRPSPPEHRLSHRRNRIPTHAICKVPQLPRFWMLVNIFPLEWIFSHPTIPNNSANLPAADGRRRRRHPVKFQDQIKTMRGSPKPEEGESVSQNQRRLRLRLSQSASQCNITGNYVTKCYSTRLQHQRAVRHLGRSSSQHHHHRRTVSTCKRRTKTQK